MQIILLYDSESGAILDLVGEVDVVSHLNSVKILLTTRWVLLWLLATAEC